MTRIAANSRGETDGRKSIGNKTSRARTRNVKLEKSVPTPENPMVVRTAMTNVSARKTERLNKNVNTPNTIAVAIVRKNEVSERFTDEEQISGYGGHHQSADGFVLQLV